PEWADDELAARCWDEESWGEYHRWWLHHRRTKYRDTEPGRNMIESVNEPVELAGAYVRPGDVIVADGDGVIVVPREHAVAVADAARGILETDKAARKSLYERLGRPLDQTVQD
ncbi:MAG: hypothetical protein R3178_08095, partial [Rhodothermales bacterium]|nr:hypothetical protein [Rhodothermales bacterium]